MTSDIIEPTPGEQAPVWWHPCGGTRQPGTLRLVTSL